VECLCIIIPIINKMIYFLNKLQLQIINFIIRVEFQRILDYVNWVNIRSGYIHSYFICPYIAFEIIRVYVNFRIKISAKVYVTGNTICLSPILSLGTRYRILSFFHLRCCARVFSMAAEIPVQSGSTVSFHFVSLLQIEILSNPLLYSHIL